MLGSHEQLPGRRASQGAREGRKETSQKDGKPKHEEEHVEPTMNIGIPLKISIEEFSWEREDDRSTLDMEEFEQQQLVYIMNLKNGSQKDGMKLYDEESPNNKSMQWKIGLLKSPPK